MNKDDAHLMLYYLDRILLVISGDFNTKNNPITAACCRIPMKGSKYEAKQHIVMTDRNFDVYCIESSTDNDNNKIYVNPDKMIGEKKLLILKHEGLHY